MKQDKQTVKLSESQLRQVIKESIKKALNEYDILTKTNGDVEGLLNSLKKNPHFIVKQDEDGDYRIYSSDYRIYLGHNDYYGHPEWVASYLHNRGIVKPCHGYFMPHPCGNALNKLCKKFGVEFNND